MADKPALAWTNFKAADLPDELKTLHTAMLDARKAFEAAFPCREGFSLRFAYQGADWDRMGVAEVEKPKTREQVAGNLAAFLQARRDANLKH